MLNHSYFNRSDREAVRYEAIYDGNRFYYADRTFKNDKEFIMDIIRNSTTNVEMVFAHASDRLRDDRELALFAITHSPISLKYASDRLRDDKELVSEATKMDPFTLTFASPRLKNDRELVMQTVKQNGMLLDVASDRLKNDREVVYEAAKDWSDSFFYASDEIKKEVSSSENTVDDPGTIFVAKYERESLCKKIDRIPTKQTKERAFL